MQLEMGIMTGRNSWEQGKATKKQTFPDEEITE